MTDRWTLDGSTLQRWRAAAHLSVEDIAALMKLQPRIIVGIEKGYRRFKDKHDADTFLKKFHGHCKTAYDARTAIEVTVDVPAEEAKP